MSNNKNLQQGNKDLANRPTTDISDEDMLKIQKFIDDGCPGLEDINDKTLYKILDLYLGGSTYWQISNSLDVKRVIVLYLSHKHGWFQTKKEYLDDLESKIKSRTIDTKIVSQDFLMLMIQVLQKKISKKAKKYLASDDDQYADEIDPKDMGELRKTIELLVSLSDSSKKESNQKAPAVGLNIGQGVTIERDSDDKVTITPTKEQFVGDLLKKYADQRRNAENIKVINKSDISNNKDKENE